MSNKLHVPRLVTWLGCVLALSGALPAQAASLPTGRLLYSAEAPGGWQVFQVDLPDGKPQQLTFSVGDKREPSWLPTSQCVVYRDAAGALGKVRADQAEATLAAGQIDWAGYAFFPDERRLFVTQLVGTRSRRQHVFAYDLSAKTETPFAMAPAGSYGNIHLSPDGQTLALTHVLTYGSERLALLPATQPGRPLTYLTPEGTMAEYPRWSGDGRSLFAALQLQPDAPMQIHEIEIATGVSRKLPLAGADKATAPCPTPDGRGVFFQIVKNGLNSIVYWDRASGEVIALPLGGAAVEPFYFVP